jgi:8-oxo-dGTP diphosphatase
LAEHTRPKRGVVAVIRGAEQRLLIIRRSQFVVAPGRYCFPGGAIEAGETEEQALQRELWEELQTRILPQRRVWLSVTPWNVELAWWTAQLMEPDAPLRPVAAEVAEVAWLDMHRILELPGLLESNHQFLTAVLRGGLHLDDGMEEERATQGT